MFKMPSLSDWVFSAKCFVGAMLALYLALRIGLPRPFWAPLAAYVASQPFAGATKAKALFRITGSFIGGLGVIFIIPLFFNYAILAAAALGLWYGFWIFVALHDRTPRAYAFLLGGYTIGIVAMPAMGSVDSINLTTLFDLAINRVQEITVGVGSATLIHAVVFPTRAGSIVINRLDQALKETTQNILNIIDFKRPIPVLRPNLNKLSATITELRILTTNVPFEAENLRWVHSILGSTQDHLSALVPVLSAIDDRIRHFRTSNFGLPQELQYILDDIAAWLMNGSENPHIRAVRLRKNIETLVPSITAQSHWDDILILNFIENLYQLVDICDDCFGLRRRVDEGLAGKEPATESKTRKVSTLSLLVDRRKAWISALAAFLCVFSTTLMWMASGWNSFFAAPMMGGMYCLFFAAVDNPVPMLRGQFWMTLLSSIPSGIYLLWLLPSAHSFEMMVMMFFPFFIICGTYLTTPKNAMMTIPFFFTAMATLTMFDQGSANMTAFMNTQISQCIGVLFAIVFMGVFRSISIQMLVEDVVKSIWQEISKIGTMTTAPSPILVAVRMVDGISLIAPRLALVQKDHQVSRSGKLESAVNILQDLRIGASMTQLLRTEPRLGVSPSPYRSVLEYLSTFYEKEKQFTQEEIELLLSKIDQAIYETARLPEHHQQHIAIAALAGLRSDLFPDALPYSPLRWSE